MLGDGSQVCIFVQEILYLVNHLPSPSHENFNKLIFRTTEMLAPKLKDLSLIPRSHKVNGKN